MVTVIIINLNNLKQLNASKQQATPTTAPIQVVITGSSEKRMPPPLSLTPSTTSSLSPTVSPTPSPTAAECKKQIGPVTIMSPQEGEIVTKDTVCVTITTDSNYCPLTWSYSLNGGSWSNYDNKDICLYNLTSGNKTMQLKVKSSTTSDTLELQRSFIYQNPNATPTQTATSSAT